MKRRKIASFLTLVLLAFCAGGVTRVLTAPSQTDAPKPLIVATLPSPIEFAPPNNLDELLNDPLFKLDPNASKEDVAIAARNLYIKYDRYLDDVAAKLWDKIDPLSPGSREQVEEEIKSTMKAAALAFAVKFDAEIMPQLLRSVDDDSFALRDDKLPNESLRACLQVLRIVKKNDEIEKIHERELARYRNAQKADDDEVKEKAFNRLLLVDSYYLALQTQPFVDVFDLEVSKKDPNALREPFVAWGNRLANEVKRDQILVLNCDACYANMIKYVDENLALDFREKFRDAISRETAFDVYRRALNRKVNDVDVAIYREDSFDESLFKIPKNESSDFYRRRRDKIRSAQIETNAAPVPKSVKDDYNSKATDALAEIAIMISLHNRSVSNESGYVELEKAKFTPKTILLLKNEIEKSTTLKNDPRSRFSVNVPFVSIARAVVLRYELDAAVNSGDRDAALDACENFAESAEFNPDSARLLAQQLEIYAQSKTDLARDIINVTLAKAEVSTGHLGNYLRQIMKAQSEIEAE